MFRVSKVTETIATGGYPYDLYYLRWLEEVWVHTWTNATFDVISTAGSLKRTHKAIKAHVQPGERSKEIYSLLVQNASNKRGSEIARVFDRINVESESKAGNELKIKC